MNQLMIDLFNLAVEHMRNPTVAAYRDFPKEDAPGEVYHYPGFKSICGEHYSLVLMDYGMIYFSHKEFLHINQCPLYERYFKYIEKGV